MRYYLIAGERSGDLHGSNLIKALKKRDPEARFRAWGGEYMEKAGAELVVHYNNLSFMGFVEVVLYFRKVLKYFRFCKKDILTHQPDVVILIDFGGFNLRMARFLKKKNIRVFYYISPKIWAWNTKRAYRVKAHVDRMFVILPFEKDFYASYGVEVDYVGNPVADAIREHTPDPSFLEALNLSEGDNYTALLPGSRNQELISILPAMIRLAKNHPGKRFILAAISSVPHHLYAECRVIPNMDLVFNRTYDILAYARAGVITSGTATLETALWNVPQVVVYRSTSRISVWIARRVIQVKYISLVNLIARDKIVEELIQDNLTEDNLNREFTTIWEDQNERNRIFTAYKEIKNILGKEPVSDKAARLMYDYLIS